MGPHFITKQELRIFVLPLIVYLGRGSFSLLEGKQFENDMDHRLEAWCVKNSSQGVI